METIAEVAGFTAAALRPELMPTLKGEWEWIAISVADLEDE